MNKLGKCNVFIEYIHPSIRDLTVGKAAWDFVSYSNGWRHARLVITKEPVSSITGDVEGDVYDVEKDDQSKIFPKYEKFRAVSLNRYLPIGNLKDNMSDDKIKVILNQILSQHPKYNLISNNCEDLTKALCKIVIGGSFPTLEKMRGEVHPIALGSYVEALVTIVKEAGFEDAIIYDPKAILTKGSGPKNIDDAIKEEK